MPALFSHYLSHIEAELKAAAEAAGSLVALDPVTESPVEAKELAAWGVLLPEKGRFVTYTHHFALQ